MDLIMDFDGNVFVRDPITGEKTAVDGADKDNTLDMTEDQRTIRRLEEELFLKDCLIADYRRDVTQLRLRSTSEIDKTQLRIKPASEIANLKASIDGLERQAALFRDQGNELRSELSAKEEIISALKREIKTLNFRNEELERLNHALKAQAGQKLSKDIRRG